MNGSDDRRTRDPQDEFLLMAMRYGDGDLAADDLAQFEALLSESREHRDRFVQYLWGTSLISESLADASDSVEEVADVEMPESLADGQKTEKSR
jgi:hypothetical protein